MVKLIILITGIIGISCFSSLSLSFSDESLPSAIPCPCQNQEVTPSQGENQVVQMQDKVTMEQDEPVKESAQGENPADEEEIIEEEESPQIADPLRVWNKGMYYFNDKFYFWLLKPVSQGYSAVVPEGMRISVSNFFYNITTPIRFVSNLLQLKMKTAGNELLRFAVNSTFGVGGLGDFAKDEMDVKRHDEDLGQAFGHHGIGHGFYIVWPILGPSSLRDTVGLVGDLLLHPVTYVNPYEASFGIFAYEDVNETSFHIGEYEDLKKSAIDPYISIRDAYVQNRQKKVEE